MEDRSGSAAGSPSQVSSGSLGRYHLGEPLGGGPTGEVFRAKVYGVAGYERQYAVKRFHATLAADPRAAEIIASAARASATISHPYVGRLHEYGVAGGATFVAAELVNGVDLARLLAGSATIGDPVPRGTLLGIIAQIARGVGYAHGRGVVHGGLCPTNVIVSVDGDPKVLDFGFLRARLRGRPASDPTLVARLPYLAPEQLDGLEPTPRTDVFALATLAYELLSGERAFTGRVPAEIESSIVSGPREAADVPPLVWEVLQRAFARVPAERFATGAELADALEAVARRMALPGGRSDMAAAVRRVQARTADLLANASGALSFPLPSPPPSTPGVPLSQLFAGGQVPRPPPRTTLAGLGVPPVMRTIDPMPGASPPPVPRPRTTTMPPPLPPAVTAIPYGKDPPAQRRRSSPPPEPAVTAPAGPPPGPPSAEMEIIVERDAPLSMPRRPARWPFLVIGVLLFSAAGLVAWDQWFRPADAVVAVSPDAGAVAPPPVVAVARPDAAPVLAAAAPPAALPPDAAAAVVAPVAVPPVAVAPVAPPDAAPVAVAPPDAAPIEVVVAPPPEPTPPPEPSPGDAATLVIVTRPAGAAVYLDGAAKGKTPLELPATGDHHKLALLLAGHKLVKQDIQGRGRVDVELEKADKPKGPAGIKIKCASKQRYYVLVDGVHTGLFCPTERINVAVGEHTVEIYDALSDAWTVHKVPVHDTHFSVRLTVEP